MKVHGNDTKPLMTVLVQGNVTQSETVSRLSTTVNGVLLNLGMFIGYVLDSDATQSV